MEYAGLMPKLVTRALTGPGVNHLDSGGCSLSLLDCHLVTDVTAHDGTDVTDVTAPGVSMLT